MVKVNKWTYEETELLEDLFKDIKLQSSKHNNSQSKTILIKKGLKKAGFYRSKKSIRRKLYRLGLTDYSVKNEPKVEVTCFDCSKVVKIPKRYSQMYAQENFRCPKCKEIKRREWANTDKGKKYHKEYSKRWYKIKKMREESEKYSIDNSKYSEEWARLQRDGE